MGTPSFSQAPPIQSRLAFTKALQAPRMFAPGHCPTPSQCPSLVNRRNGFVPKGSLTAVNAQSSFSFPVPSKKPTNPLVVIDNYDSFTYNLCQDESQRNPDFTRAMLEFFRCPPRFGDIVANCSGTWTYHTTVWCVHGFAIGEAFGGNVVRAPGGVVHGKSSLVYYDERGDESLFIGLPNPFTAGRYHSLVIDKESFPGDELEITAWTKDGIVMAARHRKYKHLKGVQFHPESIISKEGMVIVRNFIKLIERKEAQSLN